jgi:diaminopimelate decarboxylase
MPTGHQSEPLAALRLFPDSTEVTATGELAIAGTTIASLAERFGTPLYVYDEDGIRDRGRRFQAALAQGYPGRSTVCYAAKAYCAPWLVRLLAEEGLGLDVVSGGELFTALAADFPRERLFFHGNNKSLDELAYAVSSGVGRIIVDNLDEVDALGHLTARLGVVQPVVLRVGPGVDASTHAHLTTGAADTKFGLGIAGGGADRGIDAILRHPTLDLHGIHAHIGSQIFEIEPYEATVDRLFGFAASVRDRTGAQLREISPGGGYGVRYTPDAPEIDPLDMIGRVGRIVADAATRYGLDDPLPVLTIEPGRSMIASSAVAVYRVGSVKSIPGGRTYVAVDGGMADNIRPTAYGAAYTAVIADRPGAPGDTDVAVAGRYCETGDILIQQIRLPAPKVGDLLVIPAAGAYQLSMASNYNMSPRPAVVAVARGQARLTRRRESYADLLAAEIG